MSIIVRVRLAEPITRVATHEAAFPTGGLMVIFLYTQIDRLLFNSAAGRRVIAREEF